MRRAEKVTRAVHEVMTTVPMTVSPETRFDELLELFGMHDVGAFPVVGPDGVLLGLVTKLDLLRPFVMRRPVPDVSELAAEPAKRLMRPGILSLEAGDTLLSAVELMVETRLHSLPVVRRGGAAPVLVGIVSRGDLLRALMAPAPVNP